MGMIQYLHISFEIWSAVFCLIAAIFVVATVIYDHDEAKALLWLLTVNIVSNVAEAFAYYYRGEMSTLGFYMTRISNFTVFLCNQFLLLFGMDFLCRVLEKNGAEKPGRLRKAAVAIIYLNIALLALSRVFGFYYAFDAQNRYYRLDSYWIMLALSEVVVILIIIITFTNWKYLSRIERIEFLTFEFLPLVAVVIQAVSYGVSITTLANTVSILLIFMTYEYGYADYTMQKERRLLAQMISAFAQAIDAKDSYTGGHSTRVAEYSRMLAEQMGLSSQQIDRVYKMALLHDVGKIGVSDLILRKNGKLSDEEYNVIKEHPSKGSAILDNITEMPELSIGARWHHERYDGTGYPDRIKGTDIPIEARIICVADSYDAMTSSRGYRPVFTQEMVRDEIVRCAGTQFDPQIAACMLRIIDADTDYNLREHHDGG